MLYTLFAFSNVLKEYIILETHPSLACLTITMQAYQDAYIQDHKGKTVAEYRHVIDRILEKKAS